MPPTRPTFSGTLNDDTLNWVYHRNNTTATFHERIDDNGQKNVAVQLRNDKSIDGERWTQELSCDDMTTLQQMERQGEDLKRRMAGTETVDVNRPDMVETIGDTKVSYWVVKPQGDQKEVIAHMSKADPNNPDSEVGLTLDGRTISDIVQEGGAYKQVLDDRELTKEQKQNQQKDLNNEAFDQMRETKDYAVVEWVDNTRDPQPGERISFDRFTRENVYRGSGSDARDFRATTIATGSQETRESSLFLTVEKEGENFGRVCNMTENRGEAVADVFERQNDKHQVELQRSEAQEAATTKFHEQSFTMDRSQHTPNRSM